jgi:rhomboid protease GluP
MHSLVPAVVEPSSPADPTTGGRAAREGWLDQAPVTLGLLGLDVAIFAVQVAMSAGKSIVHLTTREALAFGASYSLATLGEHRWETLVTACFLHDGVLHLALNMFFLWGAGPIVEKNVGSARMAPMYLAAGAAGNLLSMASTTWLEHGAVYVVGASGAISGVLVAALVLGWRVQGWGGPLTRAMVRWLVFFIVLGVVSRLAGSQSNNAAHIGGAVAGGAFAATWRRDKRYSPRAARFVVTACAGLLVACIGVVGWHDQTDPFATVDLQERADFTTRALMDGRCADAHRGLLSVERLRRTLGPVTQLRDKVQTECGHVGQE